MKKPLLNWTRQILAFIGLVGLLLFGLWGLKPTQASITTHLGHFRLTPFRKGLALYQQDRPFFYNFSPYDDYYVNQKGHYVALITKEDIIKERFITELNQKPLEKKIFYLANLLYLYQPQLTFKSVTQAIHYWAETENNTLALKRRLQGFPQVEQAQARGITISFAEGDFVFDEKGQLYTHPSEKNLQTLERLYNLDLTPSQTKEEFYNFNLWTEIPGQKVFIFNPELPGVIQIEAKLNQKIMFNKLYRLIGVEERGDFDQGDIEMKIKILNNLSDIHYD